MSTSSDEPPSARIRSAEPSTFVFADLAGFTALTEAHGDDEAIEIASDFTARVRQLLPEYQAQEVKTIGDEVMIRVEDPVKAVNLGIRIAAELAFHGSPPVRVGMHSGAAVPRDGDWYGGTVNLASRVADVAKPGEVLLTGETREQLGEPDGFVIEEYGPRHFKHLPDPIPIYRAITAGAGERRLEIDPVCRMAVDPGQADSERRRRGISYFFCSAECRAKFDAEPRRYIATSPAARAARRGFIINLSVFTVLAASHLASWIIRGYSGSGPPPMLFFFIAWAVVLVFHYRAVRAVL